MKTVQQLAMWFVNTIGFLSDSGFGIEVRGSLALHRQVDRLGEALARFVAEIASRTKGVTLKDFTQVALIRAIRQELDDTLRAIEGLAGDIYDSTDPHNLPDDKLLEVLKECMKEDENLKQEVLDIAAKSYSSDEIGPVLSFWSKIHDPNDDEIDTQHNLSLLEKIIPVIERDEDLDDSDIDKLTSCAERLLVLVRKADPEWRSSTDDGMADLSDLLGLKRDEEAMSR